MRQKLLLLSLVLALLSIPASAQMTKFKALFLFNFAKNIIWPASTVNNSFVVTVVGDNDLAAELKELSKVRKVGSHELIIKEASTVHAEMEESHMIYLGQNKSSLMPMLASYHKGKPTLIIGGKDGLCSQGAGISFVTLGGKLKFQISPGNIENHGLELAQKLVYLGIEVQ
jgi:hypothetical protein